MRAILKLSLAYLTYYKKQTLALFMGIVLSSALLTGVGSLLYSGMAQSREKAREEYGDWHYYVHATEEEGRKILSTPRGRDYEIEKAGLLCIKKVTEEPYKIQLVYGDETYLEMMGRELKEGAYPANPGEIALDSGVLLNLGLPEKLGTQVSFREDTFTLCGILNSSVKNEDSYMEAFVSQDAHFEEEGFFLYIKYKEDGAVYRQMSAVIKALGIKGKYVYNNWELINFVGGVTPESFLETIKAGLTDKNLGLPYIYGALNEDGAFTNKLLLCAIGIFSIFIIYSLFQMSVIRRISQYSVMQTFGMSGGRTFFVLAGELGIIYLAGYPVGSILGNGIAGAVYERIGKIFVKVPGISAPGGHTGLSREEILENAQAAVSIEAGAFHPGWKVIFLGAVFFLAVILLISLLLVRKMNRLTLAGMIYRDSGRKNKNRRIYSLKRKNMAAVLTNKFMLQRKGTFIGILLSLSMGGILFLGAAYVTENTAINNEKSFKADDGLGSDIQVYENSDSLSDVIPERLLGEIQKLPGVKEANGVNYILGEIPLYDGRFTWDAFYAETANEEGFEPEPDIMEKYNGRIVRLNDTDYKVKVNVYGYDDQMLSELLEYLVDGEIDPDQMLAENMVIFKPLMDGQGNYNQAVLTGDTIRLKTPKDINGDSEALRFLSTDDEYRELELKVCAQVKRPLGKNPRFIGDDGTNIIDIIMTAEQFEKYFGVKDYSSIGVRLEDGANNREVSRAIRELTREIPKCMLKDYTQEIENQNLYISQKMLFFYGIAIGLLVISFLHIINSMQYLVAARRHEFGIMRAMGITDAGFRKMLAREGLLYGLYTNLVMAALYFFVQKMLYFVMIKIYYYIESTSWVSMELFLGILVLNLVLCVGAMEFAGKDILEKEIIREINT